MAEERFAVHWFVRAFQKLDFFAGVGILDQCLGSTASSTHKRVDTLAPFPSRPEPRNTLEQDVNQAKPGAKALLLTLPMGG
jgi:hypothetical protein